MLLTGDAGIGKTALATEVLARARDECLVLTARAHAFGTSTQFGVWVEALERHLRTLDSAAVLDLAGFAAADLAPLLRSVEACGPAPASRPPSGYRLVEGLVALVAAVAERQPAVVFLDDAHLADAPSWETLHFLARDRPGLPLTVIAAARPDELAEHPVAADVVFALEQDGLLRRFAVGPLDDADLEELARRRSGRDVVPHALVHWLQVRSRGNALYATGLLSALIDQGGPLAAPALAAVPQELGERVRTRLRGLDADALQTLDLLAVLGSRAELADVARLSGMALDRVAMALDQLVRRNVVREDTTGPAPAFELAHPLVQEVIYESAGGPRRALLHRRIGRTLLASGELAAAASHLARSASTGDPEAIDALVGALHQAEERSLYRAVTAVLGELVRLLPSGDERWLAVARAMDPAADWVVAHLAEEGVADAQAAMRRIEPLVERSGDPRLRALVQLRLACFGGIGLGQPEEALRASQAAAELFEAAGERALALAGRIETLFLLTVRGDHEAALEGADELMPAIEALGDDWVTLQHLLHLSTQLPWVGDFEGAIEVERRGMALARQTGDHYRYALFRNRHRLALAHMGRVREAQGLAAGTWESPAAADALASECEIVVDWLAGDLDGALRALAAARTRNRTAMSTRQVQFLVYGLRAGVDADRTEGLEHLVRRSMDATQGTGMWAPLAQWGAGTVGWRAGEAGALAELVEAAGSLLALGAVAESLYALVDVAEVAAERRAQDVVTWAATEASATAGAAASIPFHGALADLVKANAYADANAGRSAAEVFEDLDYRLFLGRAQRAVGCALSRADPDGAVAALDSAVSTFRTCGAAWHATRTLELLRALGSRGRRAASAAAGPEGLSAREWEVARQAAAGRTAREIAESLFIGERTVETHLRNAYGKLRVRSKRELVQRAEELGLRT